MKSDGISIIGMACLLPEANNPNEYWNNLLINRNCLKKIPEDRFHTNQFKKQLASNFCMQGGFLTNIAHFDRQFFGVSPNEAKQMDPQQRLSLQEAWHCIEDANIDLKQLQQQTTGVFTAQMSNDYLQLLIDIGTEVDQYTCLGNYASSLANRVSHHLKLSGPSISTNAACAGSLAALHQARQSLLLGECDYALVISANLICHPLKYLCFSMAGMLSRTNQCHTFEAHADGYVPGEGICAVLLCSSQIAFKRHHHIYANILQSGMNHNAGANAISSPNIKQQESLIHHLYQPCLLKHLDYIELHGTGTSLGDPIEYQALKKALGDRLEKPCVLGSVKSIIGHLEASAGLAGLIKVILMLEQEMIVPSLDVQTINPLIDITGHLFQLNASKKAWPIDPNNPRVAGISSMGFGGVNAHVIVSDPTKENPSTYIKISSEKPAFIPFLMSLKTEAPMDETRKQWQAFLESTPADVSQVNLASMHNRSSLEYRFSYLAKNPSKKELLDALTAGNFIKKQELPIILFDEIDFEITTDQQKKLSLVAQSKIEAINLSDTIPAKQKVQMTGHITLYDALIQANIQSRMLIGEQDTLYGLLFYLGCISIEGIESHLGKKADLRIQYETLNSPLIIGSTSIINEKYLRDLFTIEAFQHTALKEFLSQSLLLSKHQYTFQGLLKRWQIPLEKNGIDLFGQWYALLNTWDATVSEGMLNPTQKIVIIAILSSLERLKKTWGLNQCLHEKMLNVTLQDLVYLVSRNILDENHVIYGIMADTSLDFRMLIHTIQAKLSSLDGLPYLRSQVSTVPYQTPSTSHGVPWEHAENNVIYIGKNNAALPKAWSAITGGNIEAQIIQTLVNQWLYGQDVRWSLFFPNYQKQKIALPNYSFHSKETFWPNT